MEIGKLITLLAIVGIVSVGLTVVPYVLYLGALPISSASPEPWAHFGTYVGGVLGPVFAFLNLVVVAYIAIRVTELQQTGLATKRLILDLYNEWHGDELHQSRIEISDLIESNKLKQIPLPTLRKLECDDMKIGKHAFRIYHFFEKWVHLTHERQIDSGLLCNMLTTYADWWNAEFFTPIRSRETDKFMIGTFNLIEAEVFSKIKPLVAQK